MRAAQLQRALEAPSWEAVAAQLATDHAAYRAQLNAVNFDKWDAADARAAIALARLGDGE